MPKSKELTIIDDEADGSVVVSGKDKTDPNPIDEVTGESMFDDIDPRFRIVPEEDDEPAPRKKRGQISVGDELEDEFEEPEQEEEELEESEEESEEEEEEEQSRGTPFQKRIGREVRLRRELQADVQDLSRQVEELRAEKTQQASEAEFNTQKATLTSKIEDTKTKLAAAVEAGDTKLQIELTDQLSEQRANLIAAETVFKNAKEALKKAAPASAAIVRRKANAWIRKHPRFETDEKFSNMTKMVDRQLISEGSDPSSDEHYEEMDKRLSEYYPKEFRRVDRDSKTRRAPIESGGRETASRRPAQRKIGDFSVSRDGKVHLTKQNMKTMRTFGMDPTNREHVRAFIQNNLPARKE